ncbi:MAG: RcpC/CpaB family pilus assembly protein, partial [Elusimicrobiales bacterium]|nr:RcpC/CpaB family pilus assembly protein [Elusimicrobiales bacterium]
AASQQLELLVAAMYAGDGKAAFEARVRTLQHVRDVFRKLLLPAPPASARAYAEYEPEPRLFPGYRAASLPVRGSQAMFLKPGDRVDMMVTFDALMADERKEKVTATILQNVLVLDVARAADPEGMAVVRLLCNPNEAQYAALSLMQGGGNISLPRRAEGDAELHPMEIATFRKLFK